MRIFLVFILSFGISFLACSQEGPTPSANRLLFWQKGQPLQWAHFKGKPDTLDVVHGAVTYAGIDVKVERIAPLSGVLTFKAKAIFDQALSWVHPAKKDSRLLAHEQLHFDIAEVYARRLEKKLNSLRLTQSDKETIKKIRQQYKRAQLDMQERYDKETLHGIRERKQFDWRKRIDQHLQDPKAHPQLARKKLEQVR